MILRKDLLPCAILVPSLNRPQRLREVVANIHDNTPEPHRILFCVGDQESKGILIELGEWFLDDEDDPDKRYVTRMNKLIAHIGHAQTIFFGSDDVVHYMGWLSAAHRIMEQGPSVVVVNDLRNPNGTQAVIRTAYLDYAVFDDPGQAFHAGYSHNYADTEMFYTAHKRGAYARSLNSFVEHLHPLFESENSMPWDDTYRNASIEWDADQAAWEERLAKIDEAFA